MRIALATESPRSPQVHAPGSRYGRRNTEQGRIPSPRKEQEMMKTSHLAAILTAAALALPASARAQSAGQAVCSALDVFRTFNMGIPGTSAIFNVAPSCTPANPPPARYYVGSGPAATNPNDLLP